MSILQDIYNRFAGKAAKVQNISKNQPSKVDVFKRIYQSQVFIQRDTIRDWVNARDYAQSIQTPMRYELIRIYDNAAIDAQVKAMVMQRKAKTLSKKFMMVDSSGVINPKATELLTQHWFYKFLDMALDSVYYGHSLISLGDVVNDAFPNIQLVPRPYVIPERSEYSTTYGNPYGVSYVTPEMYNWFIGVGGERNLGIFNAVIPYYIYKKNATAAWSEFTEVFGQPIRIGKTDVRDESMRGKMAEMLENMGSNAWAVLDNNDIVELVESNKTDAYNVFQELITLCDGYISKIILGQTMTSDNGSSRSQAEVHERVANDIGLQDNRMIEYVVNDMLLPRMRALGITGLDGLKFIFEQGETLTLEESAKIDEMFLKNGYLLPEEYILKKYGSPVFFKPTASETKPVSQGVASAKKP